MYTYTHVCTECKRVREQERTRAEVKEGTREIMIKKQFHKKTYLFNTIFLYLKHFGRITPTYFAARKQR